VDTRIAGVRDTLSLCAAVVLGTVLAPQIAFVGLPVAAAGIAGLMYRGRAAFAASAVVAGVVAVGVVRPSDALFAVPVLAAVMLTVWMLPKRPVQAVAGALIAVLALASVGIDAFLARAAGSTLPATVAKEADSLVAALKKSMGSSASADLLRQLHDAARTIASAWPSAYFQSAVFVGILVIAAVAWASSKTENPLDVPPLSRLDLTPHVLWAFVGGLLLLATSYGSFSAAGVLGIVGLNLVLCARTLFFLQGVSVSAGLLDRAGVGSGGRILALAALTVLDALTLVISFSGLLVFFFIFRRLPRDGVVPVAPEPSTRRW